MRPSLTVQVYYYLILSVYSPYSIDILLESPNDAHESFLSCVSLAVRDLSLSAICAHFFSKVFIPGSE